MELLIYWKTTFWLTKHSISLPYLSLIRSLRSRNSGKSENLAAANIRDAAASRHSSGQKLDTNNWKKKNCDTKKSLSLFNGLSEIIPILNLMFYKRLISEYNHSNCKCLNKLTCATKNKHHRIHYFIQYNLKKISSSMSKSHNSWTIKKHNYNKWRKFYRTIYPNNFPLVHYLHSMKNT